MIRWTDKLRLGNERIDTQHQVLIRTLEELYEACRMGEGLKELEKMIVFLEGYVELHFRQEEALQRKYGYPKYELHKKIHDEYRQQIREIMAGKSEEGYTTKDLAEVIKYLNQMIVVHICKEDTDIAAYIKGRKATLIKEGKVESMLDDLTGILTHESFLECMQELIQEGEGERYYYVGVDLAEFSQVNASYGFEVGDQVLMYMSGVLQMYCENIVAIGRLYADKFGIFIEGKGLDEEYVMAMLKNIKEKMEEGFRKEGSLIPLSVCIGAAAFPEDARLIGELRRAVNCAVSRSVQMKGHPVVKYNEEMTEKITRKSKLIKLMQHYQLEKYLKVVYQPICEAKTGRLKGYEALLRLVDEKGEVISPVEFIPLAEENRLINELTYFCIHQVGSLLAELPKEKVEYITINLSPIQVGDKCFMQNLDQILEDEGYDRTRIFFEITESALVENFEMFIKELKGLREKGAQILIDDFGQGYSSLAYLANLEVDAIKIDKAFLKNIHTNPKTQKVLSSITNLAHEIGLHIVIEGIETKAEWEIVKTMKVDRLQGYYFSKPLERDMIHTYS